ncbi:hypothetical protein A8D61_33200 [Burkholderia cenocepacia]|nr:hypothetical protein A8D61_33200 [Burkholderia cenocepacia]ONJ10692.1 hypothetical protein A8D82_32820 [Burkholderia cenocepacia]ONN81275.1 hypothetical protein A8D64_27785 [Burkholderia cenocepacia]ONN86890.1 hypothetical protein A8D62_23350 [Burkholderia cenocepacia]ONN87894.1 hypothetical protein A8D63_18350 [Burkholderia cenocepacia]
MWRHRATALGIHVWETTWLLRSMTGAVVPDTTRGVDGCFMGGDIDTLMRDAMIVALARSPQQQSVRALRGRSM